MRNIGIVLIIWALTYLFLLGSSIHISRQCDSPTNIVPQTWLNKAYRNAFFNPLEYAFLSRKLSTEKPYINRWFLDSDFAQNAPISYRNLDLKFDANGSNCTSTFSRVSGLKNSKENRFSREAFPLEPVPEMKSCEDENCYTKQAISKGQALAIKTLKAIHDNYMKGGYKGKVSPHSHLISNTQLEQLIGFSNEYFHEAASHHALTPQECLDRIISIYQQCLKNVGYPFQPHSTAVNESIDYHAWARGIWEPLIDISNSKLLNTADRLAEISKTLKKGDNVLLLSNHQTEPDPQVIQMVLEHLGYAELSKKVVLVAGHRVRSDPLSTPFSMGCNLICVHSKKYINSDPETKLSKQEENIMAMSALQQLLANGGALIWVAPSGGRDRPNASGVFSEPDAFDPKTVQMFQLLSKKAQMLSNRITHIYPMSLFTGPICPPPKTVEGTLGEARHCRYSPIGLSIGKEVKGVSGESTEAFTQRVFNDVRDNYTLIKI